MSEISRGYKILMSCFCILMGVFSVVSYGGRALKSKNIQDILCAAAGLGWIALGVSMLYLSKKGKF